MNGDHIAINQWGLFAAGILLLMGIVSASGSVKAYAAEVNIATITPATSFFTDNDLRLPVGLRLLDGRLSVLEGPPKTKSIEARRVAENRRIVFLGTILVISITLSLVIQFRSNRRAGKIHSLILIIILSVIGALLLP